MLKRNNPHPHLYNFLYFKSNTIYLILSVLIGVGYLYFAYPRFFPAFFTHIMSSGYGVIEGAIHSGDLLQLIYLGWMEKMNILQGESLLIDRFIFQAPGVPGCRVFEIGPLLIVNALTSIWTTKEAAWNFSYILVPFMLGISFNYLLINKILKNRLMAVTASLIPLFEIYRLNSNINGHQSGAYYFFIPMVLYFFESLKQSNSHLKIRNMMLFAAIFSAVLGDISVGYFCALMSGIWLFVSFVFDVGFAQKKKRLWFCLKIYFKRYWGFPLSLLAAAIFGKLLKDLVLEERGTKIVRSLADAANYSGDFFPIVKGLNPFYGLGFLLVIAIIMFKILNAKRKHKEPDIVLSNQDLVCFVTYLFITIFFLLMACGAREPLVTYFPVVKLMRAILPFFAMQRSYHKMLLVVYLCSIVFFLVPWKVYLQSFQFRKFFAISFVIFFVLIMHVQLLYYLDKKPNVALYTIEKTPFKAFYDYIATHTTEEDIILDLPLLGSQVGYDGKTFDAAMHTSRRFIGGYNTAIPPQYQMTFHLAGLYNPSDNYNYESLLLFQKLKLKYITVDKHAPNFSPSIVDNLANMPWFDLKYDDNYGAFLVANEKIHNISLGNNDFTKMISHITEEGFDPALESGFGNFGNWMTQRKAFITIPNLKNGRKYTLNLRVGSLDRNSVELETGKFRKNFNIQSGLNGLSFPFEATCNRTKIVITVNRTVKATDYNSADHRDLGLFLMNVALQVKNS